MCPASLARSLRPPGAAGGSGLGALESALLLVLGPIAAVIIRLAVSRERVYRADATAALAAGDPLELAAALRTTEARALALALAPDGRRLPVGHLMFASPFALAGVARLFETHPPAGERIRRLEALAGYRR
jgi:heat shock protein HtpX